MQSLTDLQGSLLFQWEQSQFLLEQVPVNETLLSTQLTLGFTDRY